jgi:hypothetical protein
LIGSLAYREENTEEYMFQRSGSGIRRSVVMAASVAVFGMMAAMVGSAVAADKDGVQEEHLNTVSNCSANQDSSNTRKCGDTEREPRAEPKHVDPPAGPPAGPPT